MPRRLLIVGGPDPGERWWCAVCVAEWKRALVAAHLIDGEWIERELKGREDDPPKVIGPPAGVKMPPVQPGVTLAPVTKLGGPALVCWTHADALGTETALPPGLGRPNLIQGMS